MLAAPDGRTFPVIEHTISLYNPLRRTKIRASFHRFITRMTADGGRKEYVKQRCTRSAIQFSQNKN
jgi:hypothetical protein